MHEPAEARESRQKQVDGPGGHDGSWLLWVAFAIVVYLLGLGPAVKLHRAVPKARPMIEAAYFWVEPLTRSSPRFNAVAEWYVFKVWRVKR